MSQVIGTTISVRIHTEKDEFTARFDQEFLWSGEGSYVGFMKCMFKRNFKVILMSTANQFIDPNVY